jgi:uncharacterized damage-inducible protein DinB
MRPYPECMRTSILLLMALAARAQEANPVTESARHFYNQAKNDILRSAEKMPEENYAFKPAPRIRTFGQILGHIAEEHYLYCGSAKGERRAADVEKSKTGKAEIIVALKESFAYCDAVFDAVTDRTAVETVKLGDSQRVRIGWLLGVAIHDTSHYGNLVTYMRIKGLVPPSTEGQ